MSSQSESFATSHREDQSRSGSGFFRVDKREGRWQILDPQGEPFFSLALNHAEEADLKHANNRHIWTAKYGDRERWIQEGVVKDLQRFGFNTLGWTQQWIAGEYETDPWTETCDLRHSHGWTVDELRSAGLPFVQSIRFMETEDWNANPVFPDVFSRQFEQYCDYLAEAACDRLRDDPNLLGYFFVDVPSWEPHRKAPRFFAGLDENSAGELHRVASRYYEVTTDAVRRHDPNHLILGDRYNGNRGIPSAVVDAAKPFIDVLSVQYFPGHEDYELARMREDIAAWAAAADKPVIIADAGNNTATAAKAARVDALPSQAARGDHYARALEAVLDTSWLVGWHWCGYVENPVRGWGLKSPEDEPYTEMIEAVKGINTMVSAAAGTPK